MVTDFYKYHALGNDYIVIDPNVSNFNLNEIAIKLICDVHMPGGEIEVEIEGDRVFMTGSVSAVAKGEFAEDFLRSF